MSNKFIQISVALAACIFLAALLMSALFKQTAWVAAIDWSARDEFKLSDWAFEEGFLRNAEDQYYAGRSPKNFEVASDGIRLVARQERVPNAAYQPGSKDWRRSAATSKYTSASMVSRRAWQNFKLEIVASVSGGKGFWPAIWLRGKNERGFSEIDVMEHIGREPTTVHATIHYGPSVANLTTRKADREIANLAGRRVTYGAEATPARILLTIDGAEALSVDRGVKAGNDQPLRQPFNLILNVALGGAWAGPVDDAALPATMTISAIRLWEMSSDANPVARRY